MIPLEACRRLVGLTLFLHMPLMVELSEYGWGQGAKCWVFVSSTFACLALIIYVHTASSIYSSGGYIYNVYDLTSFICNHS